MNELGGFEPTDTTGFIQIGLMICIKTERGDPCESVFHSMLTQPKMGASKPQGRTIERYG